METEIRFPLDFKECPSCGSTRRIANEVLEGEKDKNKVKPEMSALLFQHQSIVAESQFFLSAPIIMTYFDVCADCGTVYCIHAEVKTAVPGGKQPPMTFGRS